MRIAVLEKTGPYRKRRLMLPLRLSPKGKKKRRRRGESADSPAWSPWWSD